MTDAELLAHVRRMLDDGLTPPAATTRLLLDLAERLRGHGLSMHGER